MQICKTWLLILAFTVIGVSTPLKADMGTPEPLSMPANISKFAFASCAKERKPQPIWRQIAATNPDLFLFIGDNVYADYWKADGETLAMSPVTEVERFARAYNTLSNNPEFAAFRRSVPMLATWDDHDYGANDAGKHYPLKRASQQHFLDFFGFSKDDPIRQQEGVYYSKVIGEKGRRVQFILLDTRYHRDDLIKHEQDNSHGAGPYVGNTNPSASMLGEAQWQWLEQQLQQPAEIRFIISSIQVVAYEHGYESWGTMPLERQRLYDLIARTNANATILLSGDRHLTEVSVDRGELGARVPYPIWDLTSSGMTDDIKPVDEHNTFRQGAVYRGSHFATIDIDWQENLEDTQIVFKALTQTGDLINQQVIRRGDLRRKNER